MSGARVQSPTPPVRSRGTASDALTDVELIWVEGRIEHWIRFGLIARERILDRRRRIVGFAPGSILAFVRWATNDYGTVLSRIDIVRAVAPNQAFQTLPFVQPGGDILLHTTGWPNVERVLQAIDAVDALGIDPCNVPAEYWRHVHNRLAARQEPRAYTADRHAAWLKRRRVGR